MKKVLITGGAGYIGSHTALDLISRGYKVISVDNFSNSTSENFNAIEKITGTRIQNYDLDICDLEACKTIFIDHPDIYAVIHFAASKYVGESYRLPFMYYKNNLCSLLNILDCVQNYNVKQFVYSSSCTVYGNPDVLPVTEKTPFKEAESPYGRTKQIGENILADLYKTECSFSTAILRYFNPAGIHKSGLIKETTQKKQETLVPIIVEVLQKKRDQLEVFGKDYDTRDGTCIRDYIHVMDLARAHTLSLAFLEKNNTNILEVFNIGTGNGVSIREMISAAEKVADKTLNYSFGPRRDGDVIATYSDIDKAKNKLGWSPKYNIEDIFKSILNES